MLIYKKIVLLKMNKKREGRNGIKLSLVSLFRVGRPDGGTGGKENNKRSKRTLSEK